MRRDGSKSETRGLNRAQQVDYRLMGSAIARVRWELDLNRRWKRDPSFYLDQTLTALLVSRWCSLLRLTPTLVARLLNG